MGLGVLLWKRQLHPLPQLRPATLAPVGRIPGGYVFLACRERELVFHEHYYVPDTRHQVWYLGCHSRLTISWRVD